MSRIIATSSDEDALDQSGMNRYGGPIYTGDPNNELAATFVGAGGGPYAFSIREALVKLVGKPTADDEILKLRNQYGVDRVAQWEDIYDYSVLQATVIAHQNGVHLPPGYGSVNDFFPGMANPEDANGKAIVSDLVKAGTDENHEFHEGLLMDKLISHSVHRRVMNDIDSKYGPAADASYHQITDQLMVDLAHLDGYSWVHLSHGQVMIMPTNPQ
jgi:hypothetical protein